MVVFRSPVQRRHRTGGFSTSPAPSNAMDEDPDNIFNATPGPSRARSVDVASIGASSSHVKSGSGQNGVPASALLQQRLAQSLMMVAESPSSKLNAPDPFKPRNQLRRSPPVAMKALDHHLGDSNKQDRMTEMAVEAESEVVLEISTTTTSPPEPRLPSSKGKERERSFDVAAKALFDSNKADRSTWWILDFQRTNLADPL